MQAVGVVTGDRSWTTGAPAERLRELVLPRVLEVVSLFASAEQAGAFTRGDAPRRAMAAWLAFHAVLASAPMAKAHPDLFDRPALVEELLRALLLGWGADARDLTAASKTGRAR